MKPVETISSTTRLAEAPLSPSPTDDARPAAPQAPQAPPAADKIIRNREVDQQAAELAKKRLLPRPPGKRLTFSEMQEYFALLTPEMWGHVVVYLYRRKPRILRQLQNPQNPNYIDCIGHPFDMDYVIQNHGGGVYEIMVVDTEAKIHSEANKLFDCDFEINMTKHEPKLNYEELDINHKANMSYVQLLQHRGILDNKGQTVSQPVQPGAAANSDVVKQILEFASKMNADQQAALRARMSPEEGSLNKSVGEILLEKMKQDDPNKHLVGMLSIIKEVLTSNKPADGSTQILEKVIQIQSEHNKTVLQLFEKLTTARNGESQNPQIEQFEQLFSFAERLSGLRGGGNRRSGWDVGLDYAKEIGVPLLQTIGNLISLRMNGRPAPPIVPPGGATAATNTAPAAFDPYANPGATRALASTLAAQTPAAAPAAPNNPAAAPSGGAGELLALLQSYGGLIVSHLNVGTPGYVFGDYVTGLLGNGMHAQIISQGEEPLVQALLSTPETALFGEPRLRKFVHEFIHYQEFLDAEEGEEESEEPEPVASAATAPPVLAPNIYRPAARRGARA